MDWRIFFDIGVTVGIGLIGFLAKELWSAVKELRKDLTFIEVALPKTYVPKEEYRDDMRQIKSMLEKISDKLDAKVDK